MSCESNQDQAENQGNGLVEDEFVVGQDVLQLTMFLNEFLTSPEGIQARAFLNKIGMPLSIIDSDQVCWPPR